MTVFGGPDIVTDGLVLHLDAANRKSYPLSGSTIYDLSGNGNNGTFGSSPADPIFSNDKGGSIVFDGDDRCTFTTPVVSSSNQSYEVWIKGVPSASAAGGFGYILHNNSLDTSVGYSYACIGYAGSVLQTREIFACLNGDWQNMGTGIIGDSTTIRQIVLTWDGSTQIAYIDGLPKVSTSLSSTPANFTTITSIGSYRTTSYRGIVGSNYITKVYNKALSANEVQQNYNALKGRYGL